MANCESGRMTGGCGRANAKGWLYFAYGSNLHPERIGYRVPNAVPVGRARLAGWRLRERMFADIEPCRHGIVEGAVFIVDRDGIRALDRYEGYPAMYGRVCVRVRIDGKGMADAFAYVMTDAARSARDGIPYSDAYREICSGGARYWGIADSFAHGGGFCPR